MVLGIIELHVLNKYHYKSTVKNPLKKQKHEITTEDVVQDVFNIWFSSCYFSLGETEKT